MFYVLFLFLFGGLCLSWMCVVVFVGVAGLSGTGHLEPSYVSLLQRPRQPKHKFLIPPI